MLILLVISAGLIGAESIPWQHRGEKKMEPALAASLVTAKKWAAEHYKDDEEIVRFEFVISKTINGYEIMVMAVFKGDFVAIDSEMCVRTNGEHEYVNAKQCMAP